MERLEGTDIEGYLSHHHDMIILSAIDEARRVAEKDVSDIQKRYIHCPLLHMASLSFVYLFTVSTVMQCNAMCFSGGLLRSGSLLVRK